MTRKRAPRHNVESMLRASLPVLNGIVADSGDILDEIQIREMDEPGIQYEQHAQKARALRRMAMEVQETLRKMAQGMVLEEDVWKRSAEAEDKKNAAK